MSSFNKIVRLFPWLHNIKPFLVKEHPEYHPATEDYKNYWEEHEKRCIEGLWGLDQNKETKEGGWRYCPPQLYYYVNFCVIEDEDESSNSSEVIIPRLRDIEWIFFTNWLICRGFSGFEDDEEYTSNTLILKLEEGKDLNPKDKKRLTTAKHIYKKDGTYKKYIHPREYLYKTHDKPLGLPLYENTALNLLWLASRGIGKSFIAAALLSHAFKFHGATRFDNTYFDIKKGPEIVVGAALSSKSADLLKKFKFMEEYQKENFGAWGENDDFIPGFFFQNTLGTLVVNNNKSPYRAEYLYKEGGVEKVGGKGTKLIHVTYESNSEAAVGTRPMISEIEEVGLCFGENTEVRMADGSIKIIQDIKVGDLVMSHNGYPEEVIEIGNGIEELYEVKQQGSNPYIVSKNHILYLEQKANVPSIKDDGIKKILVQNFNKEFLGKYRYRTTYGIKNNELEFSKKDLLLEPYYVGLYIGDGSIKTSCFTVHSENSKEILSYLEEYSSRIGNNYKVYSRNFTHCLGKESDNKDINFFRESLKTLNIFDTKLIPKDYLMSSVNDRLELLAGLIDTDGNITNKGKTSQAYEFNQTNRLELIEQVEFLARSLGFKVKRRVRTVNTGYNNKVLKDYRNKYVLRISGDIWKIPCKVNYKKAEIILHKKDFTRCKIEVNSIGPGKYFGIKLKNNPLFLLKDNTIVHNCNNLLQVWASNETTLIRRNKFGSQLGTGTGGNMEKIEEPKIIFEDPDSYTCLGFPDLWENRKKDIGLFIPAYYQDDSFRDANGNQDIEKAYEVEMHERSIRSKADNSYALDGYMMARPLVPSEMFLSGQSNIFPIAMLRDQLNKVEIRELYETYSFKGELEWNKTKTGVSLIVDLNNKLKPILSTNLDGYKNNLKGACVFYEAPEEKIPDPTQKRSLYKVVYDPYRDDGAGTSLASIIVYKGISENNWAEGLQDDIVAEYIGRMDKVDDVHEIAVKLALYYNAKIMVESNIADFIRYCKREGWAHLLQAKPVDAIAAAVKNPGKKYDVGIDMTSPALQEQAEQLWRQWLLTDWKTTEDGVVLYNLNKLKSPIILKQLIQYNRKGNFDHVSALKLLALWLSQEKKVPIEQASDVAKETLNTYFNKIKLFKNTINKNYNYHNY